MSEGARCRPLPDILDCPKRAGYDMSGVARRLANAGRTATDIVDTSHEVVVVGGGAAGIAVASSLLARKPDLDVAIIDPADILYYQPGWTIVGGGVFGAPVTARTIAGGLFGSRLAIHLATRKALLTQVFAGLSPASDSTFSFETSEASLVVRPVRFDRPEAPNEPTGSVKGGA